MRTIVVVSGLVGLICLAVLGCGYSEPGSPSDETQLAVSDSVVAGNSPAEVLDTRSWTLPSRNLSVNMLRL